MSPAPKKCLPGGFLKLSCRTSEAVICQEWCIWGGSLGNHGMDWMILVCLVQPFLHPDFPRKQSLWNFAVFQSFGINCLNSKVGVNPVWAIWRTQSCYEFYKVSGSVGERTKAHLSCRKGNWISVQIYPELISTCLFLKHSWHTWPC